MKIKTKAAAQLEIVFNMVLECLRVLMVLIVSYYEHQRPSHATLWATLLLPAPYGWASPNRLTAGRRPAVHI